MELVLIPTGSSLMVKKRLEGYLAEVEKKLELVHPHIINAVWWILLTKHLKQAVYFRTEDVDLIFLYVTTYALSSTVCL